MQRFDDLPVGFVLVKEMLFAGTEHGARVTFSGHIQSVWSPLTTCPSCVSERWCATDQLPGPALLSGSHQTDQQAQAFPGERRPHQAHWDGSYQRQVNLLCQASLQAATCRKVPHHYVSAKAGVTTKTERSDGSLVREKTPGAVCSANSEWIWQYTGLSEHLTRIKESKWHGGIFLNWYLLFDGCFKIQDEPLWYMKTLSF